MLVRKRRGAGLWTVALASLAALVAAGCGSSSSSSAGGASSAASPSGCVRIVGGRSLTVADVAPFTGPDAALGPTYLVSCDAATNAINNAGGVLGHKFNCKCVDTRGDPADAVPAVRQMYASTSNLALSSAAPRTRPPRSCRSSPPTRRSRSA